ncbi:MAG TPA: MazG nucleotide pyrophosphohydrolase domain-containing protein [Candidatus Lokiarchaeia archaeon]|nr:MazG nucleotide pyrophosphohydrolase domain-containing protein [Candidatus Lokiarchaeia archaeon]
MELQEIQQKVDDWIATHGGYWTPLSMLAAIVEELGEVAREINAIEGPKVKKTESDDSTKLKEELADLFFALTCMNNYFQIDMEMEILAVLAKYEQRDANRFTPTST